MKKQPLVSIIMNCYNGEKYLDESLKSIINQTYQNWELIFWDNISSDNSKKIFDKYQDRRFRYFLSEKHSVLYHARNLAIKKVNGEYITFLDTDDIWLKDKLEKQVKLFSNENIGLVYGNYWRYNASNFFKKKKLAQSKKLPSGNITRILLKEYFVGILTVMVRKKFLNLEKEIFEVKYDMIADMDFVLRFSKKFQFACIQEPVAILRLHDDQLQNKNIKKQAEQMQEWYEKIKFTQEFGSHCDLDKIKLRCGFFRIAKYIHEKDYIKSFKEILIFPNNLEKIKLILMLLTPKKIFNKIINLR